MAWTAAPTYTVGQLLTAALMNNVSGDLTDLDSRTSPSGAAVATSETTTSATFVDLATVGPAVTMTTGTAVLLSLYAAISDTAGTAIMSYAVSGATTLPAADAQSLTQPFTTAMQFGALFSVTGLTAGSNTFTSKYRVSGGTGTFVRRAIIVWPANKLS